MDRWNRLVTGTLLFVTASSVDEESPAGDAEFIAEEADVTRAAVNGNKFFVQCPSPGLGIHPVWGSGKADGDFMFCVMDTHRDENVITTLRFEEMSKKRADTFDNYNLWIPGEVKGVAARETDWQLYIDPTESDKLLWCENDMQFDVECNAGPSLCTFGWTRNPWRDKCKEDAGCFVGPEEENLDADPAPSRYHMGTFNTPTYYRIWEEDTPIVFNAHVFSEPSGLRMELQLVNTDRAKEAQLILTREGSEDVSVPVVKSGDDWTIEMPDAESFDWGDGPWNIVEMYTVDVDDETFGPWTVGGSGTYVSSNEELSGIALEVETIEEGNAAYESKFQWEWVGPVLGASLCLCCILSYFCYTRRPKWFCCCCAKEEKEDSTSSGQDLEATMGVRT